MSHLPRLVLALLALMAGVALGSWTRPRLAQAELDPRAMPGHLGTPLGEFALGGQDRLLVEVRRTVAVRWTQAPGHEFRLEAGRVALPLPPAPGPQLALEVLDVSAPRTVPVSLGVLEEALVRRGTGQLVRQDPVAALRAAVTAGKPVTGLLDELVEVDATLFPPPRWSRRAPETEWEAWAFHQRVCLARDLAASEAGPRGSTPEAGAWRPRVPVSSLKQGWPEAVVPRGREFVWRRLDFEDPDGSRRPGARAPLRMTPDVPGMDLGDLGATNPGHLLELRVRWPEDAPADPGPVVFMVLVGSLDSNELLHVLRGPRVWLQLWNQGPSFHDETRGNGWVAVAVPGPLVPVPGELLVLRLMPLDVAVHGTVMIRAVRVGWRPPGPGDPGG